MYIPVSDWFAAFVLTIAIEGPIVWLLVRQAEPDPGRLAVLVVFANLATHPAVWFVFTQLFLIGTLEYVVAAELWAIAAEALFYGITTGVTPRRAAVVAVAANGASFVVGRLVGAIWPDLFR